MADHDPLCHAGNDASCVCRLIARVRADEQKRSAVGIEDEITLDVRRAERERLRAQVKALPLIDYDKDDDELIRRADVLAALGDAP